MIKPVPRRAAIILAGSALALASNILPAHAATTGWRVAAKIAVRGSETALLSVAAVSPSDAWATGFIGKPKNTSLGTVVRHWTGKTWRQVTLPSKIATQWAKQEPVNPQVGAASARSVWVFGGIRGRYLRLDGTQWRLQQLPGVGGKSDALVEIATVKVFRSTDAWAFGQRISFSSKQILIRPYVAQYNGHKWSRVSVPGLASGNAAITAVAAASSGDMWAVESARSHLILSTSAVTNSAARSSTARSSAAVPALVLHWTASTGWQNAAEQPHLRAGDQLTSGVAEPGGQVWFGGSARNTANGTSPLTAEWDGTSWSVSDLPGTATSAHVQIAAMAPDGTGGIWALPENVKTGKQRIWHLHGATWSQVKPTFGNHPWVLGALALVPRTHSVWGVGALLTAKSSADGLIAIDGPLPR